jgi:hypothetical protein
VKLDGYKLKYVVKCRSRYTGCESIVKDKSGNIRMFDTYESAERYAKDCREFMGIGYHYWAVETWV